MRYRADLFKKIDEKSCADFITPNECEEYFKLMDCCEIYLKKYSFNKLKKYEYKIGTLLMQKSKKNDDDYAEIVLSNSDAHILFNNLLTVIEEIKNKHKT